MKKLIITLLILIAITAVLWAADGDQSAVLTSYVDRRNIEPLKYPVWEYIVTASFDSDDTSDATQAITINGVLLKVILVAPDGTNAVTYQVEIDDNADQEIFDSGEKAENATHTFSTYEPVTGTIDVNIGPSGAIGATNPDVLVYLRGI